MRVMDRGQKNWHFFVSRETSRPCATAGRLGIGQSIGEYTGAGGQCADAIVAGVGADGYGKRRPWAGVTRKEGTGLPA